MPYHFNTIDEVEWDSEEAQGLQDVFYRNIPGIRLSSIKQKHNESSMAKCLERKMMPEIERIMAFAIKYHADIELFLIFGHVIRLQPPSLQFIVEWIRRYPPLTFALLQAYPPDAELQLAPELDPIADHIIRNIIRSANETRIAALVALEKIAKSIGWLKTDMYIDLLMFTATSVRSKQLVQEVLLVLNDSRVQHCPDSDASATTYARKHALGVAFDRAEEAADECPCNDDGKPRKKQRVAPSHSKLTFGPDYLDNGEVIATIRIDARSSVRLHSHVRLQAASKAENQWIEAPIMDGIVVQALKGELKIALHHPAPPEMENMDWNIYDAGTTGERYATHIQSSLIVII